LAEFLKFFWIKILKGIVHLLIGLFWQTVMWSIMLTESFFGFAAIWVNCNLVSRKHGVTRLKIPLA